MNSSSPEFPCIALLNKAAKINSFFNQDGAISLGWAPTVDGTGGMLPDEPFNLRNRSEFNQDVEVMAGHTSEDGSMYLLPCKVIIIYLSLALVFMIYLNSYLTFSLIGICLLREMFYILAINFSYTRSTFGRLE